MEHVLFERNWFLFSQLGKNADRFVEEQADNKSQTAEVKSGIGER